MRDLARKDSGGFGSLPVHGLLRRAQLEECLRLRPQLLQEPRFVDTWLVRLQPSADQSWQQDPEARARQFARLWEFVQRLSPSFNSLKAHVLFHWLQHDLSQGAPDKQRFLAYLQLPRQHSYPSAQLLRSTRDGSHFVDLKRAAPTQLPPIGNDATLLRACFEYFFAREDGYEAYAEFVDANWLKLVFAEQKLLLGQGDPQQWYAQIDNPALVDAIEKRVELRFPASSRTHFGGDDPVELVVETKNVPTLLVKVFAIDGYRYLVEKQKEVDATIELDGIVANHEQTYRYEEPALRRVARTFSLPQLAGPGTYVVEFVGNGISSRAVIHKGGLRLVERSSAGGQVLRVHDEAGRLQNDAIAWFGGREYRADERGEILLPFSTAPGAKKVVLRAAGRASLATFEHRAESYVLHGGVHVEREALVAGASARVLLRPQLRLLDQDLPLQLLEDRVLTIVATDLDGVSTTQEVRDPQLTSERELVHEITVPERLAGLQVSLRGKLKDLAGKDVLLASTPATFACNQIDLTAETGNTLLRRTPGGYVVELRGKNGEPLAGRTVQLQLRHRSFRDALDVPLQTGPDGRIDLGALPGIDSVTLARPNATGGSYVLATTDLRLPDALHGRTGEVLRLPYDGTETAPTRAEFSLLGGENDEFSHLALADGFVELRDLAPGDYELRLHRTGARIPVRITQGERSGTWLIGRDRTLSASDPTPLQVRSTTLDGDGLVVQLSNPTAGTRVHVLSTHYLPAYDVWAQLFGAAAAPAVASYDERTESSYHAGRKLGDEYRYVLERRLATKYFGNMLARPSLLTNPWALEDSSNAPVGLGGGEGGAYGGRGGAGRGRRSAKAGVDRGELGGNPGAFANLDWLPRGAFLSTNLTPDQNGVVRVPLAALGSGQQIVVLALDGDQSVRTQLVRQEQPLAPRSRALPASLDPTQHFTEQTRIEFVAAGTSTTLADARSAKVEIHDSLRSVFRLFTTISQDQELAKFGFLIDWPQLDAARQRALYDQHACHELHLFLFHKDPAFFAAVVKPLLANKLDKTFVDHWLLGDDLRRWLEPWTFAQLNLVERVLLSKRLGGDEGAAIARTLREALELRPVDRERFGRLLDLALRSNELADQDKAGLTLGYRGPGDAMPPGSPAPAPTAAAPSAGSGGPATGGPGGPATGGLAAADRMAAAKELKNEDAAKDGEHEKLAQLAEQTRAGLDDFGPRQERSEELRRRGVAAQLYRAVAATKLLVESNWWHRRLEQTTPDVVAPNRFWVDYATAPAGQPFASAALVEATGSCLEMLCALAVLDLPFEGRQARGHRQRHLAHAEGRNTAAARAQGSAEDRGRRRPGAAAARPELLPPRRSLPLRERRAPRRLRHRRVRRRRRLWLPGRRHQPDVDEAHRRRAAADPRRRAAAAEGLLDQGPQRRAAALRHHHHRVRLLLPRRRRLRPLPRARRREGRARRQRRATHAARRHHAEQDRHPVVGTRLAAGQRAGRARLPRRHQRAAPRTAPHRLAHAGPRVLHPDARQTARAPRLRRHPVVVRAAAPRRRGVWGVPAPPGRVPGPVWTRDRLAAARLRTEGTPPVPAPRARPARAPARPPARWAPHARQPGSRAANTRS